MLIMLCVCAGWFGSSLAVFISCVGFSVPRLFVILYTGSLPLIFMQRNWRGAPQHVTFSVHYVIYFHCLLHPEEAEWRNVGYNFVLVLYQSTKYSLPIIAFLSSRSKSLLGAIFEIRFSAVIRFFVPKFLWTFNSFWNIDLKILWKIYSRSVFHKRF